jgi:hypothetical protein
LGSRFVPILYLDQQCQPATSVTRRRQAPIHLVNASPLCPPPAIIL